MATKRGGALPVKDIKHFLYKSYSTDKPSDYGDYLVDHSLSDHKVQVYHHPHTKRAVVVHRGTQDMRDVANDVVYTSNNIKGDRFYHSRKVQQAAEKKYGAKNTSTLGHSLGSLIASDVGRNSREIINYNKPVDIKGRWNKNEYNIKTTRDPFSFFVPRWGTKTVKIKSKTVNPVHEHSIDRLDDLNQEKMIGAGLGPRNRGLAMYTVKELKQRIKEFNRSTSSKIKGYGKMKKKELKEAIHQIPYMMRGGAPSSDHRFQEFEVMIDDMLAEAGTKRHLRQRVIGPPVHPAHPNGDELLRWRDIEGDITNAVYLKFPVRKVPKQQLLPEHIPEKGIRFEAINHLKEYFDEQKMDSTDALCRTASADSPKKKRKVLDMSPVNKIVEEFFHLLDYEKLPIPESMPKNILKAGQQTIRNMGVNEGTDLWLECVTHFVKYYRFLAGNAKQRAFMATLHAP